METSVRPVTVAAPPTAAPIHSTRPWTNVAPNWFASVMGTGIVAVAAATLPEQFPGLHTLATAFWALAAAMLIIITVLTVLHWHSHAGNPVISHFYGAVPMAMLTVGAGTLLLGRDVIGLRAAVDVDWALWIAGTATGLLTAAAIPYLAFTRHRNEADSAFGGWLMPVVPPMVSASTGALLLPYTAPGQPRLTLFVCCFAMFGISLLPSIVIITLIWQRLALHKIGPSRMVPTLWIVLGPLGQSVTAANLLGANAHLAVPQPYSTAFQAFGVVYGLPVLGFALLWATIATAITVRTARQHLPFSLTWWSFTFPVGTCVTALTGLAGHTNDTALRFAAATAYATLVAAWLVVASRTVRSWRH
ncbi:MAG TPA: TDT family transporter [Actinospica sp.]|jgi:C4-dicarboxylate transporter/malic acid transport protein|nr:TDT family transporter [Actinospica sp.]